MLNVRYSNIACPMHSLSIDNFLKIKPKYLQPKLPAMPMERLIQTLTTLVLQKHSSLETRKNSKSMQSLENS